MNITLISPYTIFDLITARTMHSGFSQLLGKLVVKYVSTYTKGTLKTRGPWATVRSPE